MRNYSLVFISLFFAACAAQDGDAETATQVSGVSHYRDAETDHAGNPQEAASPAPQDVLIEIAVRGEGDLPDLDPQCTLDATGEFQALYTGTAQLDDTGLYLGSLAAADGSIETLGGCEIPDLTVGLITDVVVRASLEATTENCQTYCAASARADAEAECGADASSAECRAAAEAEAEAACTTTCTTEDHAIVAEISLGASAVGTLDADALRAAALGELTADLTFDHLAE